MPEKNDGGDKTERATPHRLREARKKGEVAKSRDIASTAVLLVWLVCGLLLSGLALDRFVHLFDLAFQGLGAPTHEVVAAVGWSAAWTFLLLTLIFFLPASAMGVLAEFFQVGPIFQTEKMKFKLEHLNPGEGLKRMFNTDNLFEVGKSLVKTVLLVLITWILVASQFSELLDLPRGDAGEALAALGKMTVRLVGFTVGIFALVSVLDYGYQRFSFDKKMRMSRRDIRQENKDSEGDPHIRAQRRQLHQEWANRNAVEAARGASVLVVNPTHIAIALDYDPAVHPAPVVAAKGDGLLAGQMRAAAEEAGVPIVRNIDLARGLHERAEIDEIVPEDMFAAVAEVILWARRMKEEAAQSTPEDEPPGPPRLPPPERKS